MEATAYALNKDVFHVGLRVRYERKQASSLTLAPVLKLSP